jgi:hypothetical protein
MAGEATLTGTAEAARVPRYQLNIVATFGGEARVGIAQGLLLIQNPPKPFGSGNFSNCCTDKEVIKVMRWNQANFSQLTPANIYSLEHF